MPDTMSIERRKIFEIFTVFVNLYKNKAYIYIYTKTENKMETLQFVKKEIKLKLEKYAIKYDTTISELNFGSITEIFFKNNTLEFVFDGYVIYNDDLDTKENIGIQFTCAYKTPKGYISKKKLPVDIKDINNVSLEEAKELLRFNTDAVESTFDPFWYENQAKRKNACALNHIALNHLQPDVDSF